MSSKGLAPEEDLSSIIRLPPLQCEHEPVRPEQKSPLLRSASGPSAPPISALFGHTWPARYRPLDPTDGASHRQWATGADLSSRHPHSVILLLKYDHSTSRECSCANVTCKYSPTLRVGKGPPDRVRMGLPIVSFD